MSVVTLRPARADDMRAALDWRNDPVTRAASRDTGEVSWADHRAWFTGRLERADAPYWIGEVAGEAMGTVRLDPVGEGEAEVSIALAPHARGRGLGAELLSAAMARARAGGWRRIHAVIRHDNLASRRVFARCGFLEVSEDADLIRLIHDLGDPGPRDGDGEAV